MPGKPVKKKPANKAAKKVTKKKVAKKRAVNKGGRPSAFKDEYCELAKNYCLLGATDDDLARFFGVSDTTIDNWKHKHPQFLVSLKDGKETADSMVAQSLFRRATGYSCKETKFATFEGMISDSKEYIKHHAPDTVACIFWLKNRRPDLWRDKQELSTTTETEMVISEEVQDRIVEAVKHTKDMQAPAAFTDTGDET